MNKMFFAIIPMKCHSERIPGKNTKILANKPLFFWVINTLMKVDNIEKIIIDTDCKKISNMVTNYFDVTISMRPDYLKGDFVSVNKIIEHIINKYPNKYYIQTHVTNPLLKEKTLNEAIEFYLKNKNKYDSVFSVTRYQSRFYFKDGSPVNHDPSKLIRTQDLSPLFEENSNFYLFSRESFFKNKTRIGKNPFLYEVDKLEAIDIDTEEDFLLAELLMKENMKNGR